MAEPDTPGQPPGGDPYADLAQTHTALVFFVGDRAYKLKKPVKTGFLDFSTRQARAAACERETELNRRFAPDVYLGVAEVRDPAGEVCDHLVVMRRMPAGRRLGTLVRAGQPVEKPLRQVARMLAAAHAAAPRSAEISEQGSSQELGRRWQENVEQIRPLRGELITDADIDEVARLAGRYLAGRAPLFDARIRAGRIVDGHGDLLTGDIFCLDDGPRVLDCLEFDDRLRWVDGLDDAAFLAMDLERIGAPGLAERFIAWYAEYSADPAPASLVHHYVAYRAFVRAKVGCLRASQGGDPQAGPEVRQLTAMTLAHLRAGAVRLVLVGGLPGTGKSSLAGAVADRLGYVVLSSDRIRKELAGLDPLAPAPAPYGEGIYSAEWTERTYAELLRRAEALLAAGESVILDATWTSAVQRAAAAEVAGRGAAELVQVRCAVPAGVAAARMSRRTGSASDADSAIAAAMAAGEEPWPEAVTIDTAKGGESGLGRSTGTEAGAAGPGTDAVQQVFGVIRPEGPDVVWRPRRPYLTPG
ncbi:MAG TPA: AAA family ATPase [Streptosporangiaceae bacterium]|nr:AAA family ATPase [Streptosporangiaceae bacterium]